MAQEVSKSSVTAIGLITAGSHRLIKLHFRNVRTRLTGDQALILLELSKLGGRVQYSYLEAAGVYPGANIGYNVKILEQSGYVARTSPDTDARVVFVQITKTGRDIAKKVDKFLKPLEKLFVDAGLTHEVLTGLAHNIEEMYRRKVRVR